VNIYGGTLNSGAQGVMKIDDLLIVYGGLFDGTSGWPFYWINGQLIPVTELGTSASIAGIFVK